MFGAQQRSATNRLALAVAVLVIGLYSGLARAVDGAAVVEQRQAHMKGQGKDLGAIKAFLDGRADLAAAQAAGADLVKSVEAIPGLFPKGTGMVEFPGKSAAKPAIWTEPGKFTAAAKNAVTKAKALDAALQGGNKAAITTAFAGMIKGGWYDAGNGCGGCHVPFREKKKRS